ncbi:MAG: hypothetical protein NVSMB9_09740 [Isosphaeraceae bacterium]
MRVRDRRAVHPVLESVEERQLLSGLTASMLASKHPTPAAIQRIPAHFSGADRTPSVSPAGPIVTPPGVPQGNTFKNNTATTLLGTGEPTPRELAREAYQSSFAGRIYTGPGRFSDQGTTYYYRGLGTSTYFLHGDFNMAIITPKDPEASFLGSVIMNDKNTNSSGVQGFIVFGDRSAVDRLGRPTHLSFTADPNIYSGAFFVEAAEGTLDIKYGAKNAIAVRFKGRVYTSGLTNPLVNQDLYSRQGRPLRLHR